MATRSSTQVQAPNTGGGTPTAATGAPPLVIDRTSGSIPRRLNATSTDVQDPATLARLLNDSHQQMRDATAAALSLPMSGGVLIKATVFVGGVTNKIQHGLNRPFQGWLVTRAHNAFAPQFPVELPVQSNPSLFLELLTTGNVTMDIYIF